MDTSAGVEIQNGSPYTKLSYHSYCCFQLRIPNAKLERRHTQLSVAAGYSHPMLEACSVSP
jgi:hypothetical protein